LPFLLNIIQNTEKDANPFTKGDSRIFSQSPTTVGSSKKNHCPINDDAIATKHFQINYNQQTSTATIIPFPNCPLILNQQPIQKPTNINSGDEITVGNTTIQFNKLFNKVGQNRYTNILTTFTKILLALILIYEIGIVIILPKKLNKIGAMKEAELHQTVIINLEKLRNITTQYQVKKEDNINLAAKAAIIRELNLLANYIRENEPDFNYEQWQTLNTQVQNFTKVVDKLKNGEIISNLPTVKIDEAVNKTLKNK